MTGYEIKKRIHQAGLFYWQVAKHLGIGEYTLTRWLRGAVTKEHATTVLKAVEELRHEMEPPEQQQ